MWIFSFFLIPFLVVLLFIGGIIALILYLNKSTAPSGQLSPRNDPDKANNRMALIESVRHEIQHLHAWNGHSVQDIGARLLNHRYSTSFGGNVFQGKFANKYGEPVFAFKRVENGWQGYGNIVVCSTVCEYFLLYSSAKVSFYYNRKPLGEWIVNGLLLDPNGREIGTCNQSNSVRVSVAGISVDTGNLSYPCYLNGRIVATIYRSPRFDRSFSGEWLQFNQNTGTKMVALHAFLTEEEEHWVACILFTEMIRYGFSFANVNNHNTGFRNL